VAEDRPVAGSGTPAELPPQCVVSRQAGVAQSEQESACPQSGAGV